MDEPLFLWYWVFVLLPVLTGDGLPRVASSLIPTSKSNLWFYCIMLKFLACWQMFIFCVLLSVHLLVVRNFVKSHLVTNLSPWLHFFLFRVCSAFFPVKDRQVQILGQQLSLVQYHSEVLLSTVFQGLLNCQENHSVSWTLIRCSSWFKWLALQSFWVCNICKRFVIATVRSWSNELTCINCPSEYGDLILVIEVYI